MYHLKLFRHLPLLCFAILLVYGIPAHSETSIETIEARSIEQKNIADAKAENERKAEADRIDRLQRKCEKNGGGWKRSKCVMPPQPKLEPVVEAAASQPAPLTTAYDPNLWYKDSRTGCLIRRSPNTNLNIATWDGACVGGIATGKGIETTFSSDGIWWSKVTCTLAEGGCQGQGVSTFTSGERYEGQYKDDKYNGHGVFTYPDGVRYEGQFKDDKRNGQGVFTSPDGGRYEGQYKDDRQNGQGVLTFPNGERYEGQFKDNKRNGQGVETYADGNRYEGQFKDDKRNGQGKYHMADGSLYFEGQWANGKPVR